MRMEGLGFLVYAGIKALAYMGWCGLGARLHGHRGETRECSAAK